MRNLWVTLETYLYGLGHDTLKTVWAGAYHIGTQHNSTTCMNSRNTVYDVIIYVSDSTVMHNKSFFTIHDEQRIFNLYHLPFYIH